MGIIITKKQKNEDEEKEQLDTKELLTLSWNDKGTKQGREAE